jgi:hypothetical protein
MGIRLPPQEQVMNLGAYKIVVSFDIFFVDIETCGFAKEALKL